MQKRNICPYYKNGYCTSPILDSPTDSVTSSNRCMGNFRSCRYYVARDEDSEEGLNKYVIEDSQIEQEISFYNKINILDTPLDSECKYFQLVRTEKGLVAHCKVLGRVLTRSQAVLCNKEWEDCPFRNLA
ncbi:hypothetical protein [Sulfolobus acidocaldarius]|nr:hypothetical protein [Sulfolobus acidocaldarius]ALU30420.1 hypothetical protein ATY89_11020 [Sulfolobus acidocaldarius]ALU31141.1 hypothetical protein ATZ20_02575 [Sulfolobus acidocaldarius]